MLIELISGFLPLYNRLALGCLWFRRERARARHFPHFKLCFAVDFLAIPIYGHFISVLEVLKTQTLSVDTYTTGTLHAQSPLLLSFTRS